MKKIIIALFITVFLPITASAYSPTSYRDVVVDITARGGYNFMESVPLAGGAVGVEFWGLRAELEAGWTYFNMPSDLLKQDFCYISPMIGYSYGFNHSVYAMVGITNWGYLENGKNEQQFRQDIIYGKLKVGCNLFLTRNLFVNLDLSYLLPRRMENYCITYKGFNLKGGIGFRF